MNHIQSLIQKHCPSGVEFKALGEVIQIYTGEQFNKRDMQKVGDYPVINGGIYPSGYTNKFNENENTITISQGGASAGFVNFMLCKFWAGAHCYVVKTCPPVIANEQSECGNLESRKLDCHESLRDSRNDEVSNKFIFYFLKSQETKLMNLKHGAGIPALNSNHIKKLQIPIPPLEIQKEIVKILDAFTELEKELEKELEARRKQYEYYREKLLSFESLINRAGGGQFVKMMRLGEICEYIRGATYNKNAEIHKNDSLESWKVLRANNISLNNSLNFDDVKHIDKNVKIRDNQKLKEKDILICAGSGSKEHIGKVAFINKNMDYTFGGFMGVIRSNNDNLNNKFIYFILTSYIFNDYLQRELNTSTINNLSSSIMNNFQIPIPPLKVQNEVVEILDRFDKLTNDISEGIPAEINARKKQYEYYREQLLTFKEVK